jgi:hypothetical protein
MNKKNLTAVCGSGERMGGRNNVSPRFSENSAEKFIELYKN